MRQHLTVTVTGPRGSGKSRLVDNLITTLNYVADMHVLAIPPDCTPAMERSLVEVAATEASQHKEELVIVREGA